MSSGLNRSTYRSCFKHASEAWKVSHSPPQKHAELRLRPLEQGLGRVFGNAERLSGLGKGQPADIAEQHHLTVAGRQRADRFLQHLLQLGLLVELGWQRALVHRVDLARVLVGPK